MPKLHKSCVKQVRWAAGKSQTTVPDASSLPMPPTKWLQKCKKNDNNLQQEHTQHLPLALYNVLYSAVPAVPAHEQAGEQDVEPKKKKKTRRSKGSEHWVCGDGGAAASPLARGIENDSGDKTVSSVIDTIAALLASKYSENVDNSSK